MGILIDFSKTTIMIDAIKEIQSYKAYLTLGNYKPSTIKAYCGTLYHFFQFVNTNYNEEVPTQDHVQAYLLKRLEKGKSWSTINCDYSSMRKYFKILKDYPWSLKKLPRPKRDKTLPSILSKEDVARLINAAPNYKYQVFLTFLYATGTRLSEACNIKLEDIDSDRMQIRISQGKGGKDRFILLPQRLLELLRDYFKVYKPKTYLFNGRRKGAVYSTSAGQWTVRRARDLAGITKKCSIHTLRNCYATHHLELGTDLVYLQEQMGHKHLKTRAKYIRLCIERYRHIKHPLDVITIHYRPPKIH